MTNIHAIGASLTNKMRPAVANHTIVLRDGKPPDARYSEPINMSSPPIGQRLLTETGLELSEHERVFFVNIKQLGSFGLPKKGQVAIDQCDRSEWRILPVGKDSAWRYHGQTRDMIEIYCKADSF